jgi:general secretion pathway protein E
VILPIEAAVTKSEFDQGMLEQASMAARPLGSLLVEAGAISADDLTRALAFQDSYGGRIGAVLLRLGAVAEDRLLDALSQQLGLPIIAQNALPNDPEIYFEAMKAAGFTPDWWIDQDALIFAQGTDSESDSALCLVARDPLAPAIQEILSAAFPGRKVNIYLVASADLDRAMDGIEMALGRDDNRVIDEVSHLRELAEEAPVIELVNNLLAQAFNSGASDIHIEPAERQFRVRFRVDGVLATHLTLPRERFDAVASRVKLISGLDIAERRLPQDGRLSARLSGEAIDIRVSSLPGTFGESLVLRLLPKERKQFRLDLLGMNQEDLAHYRSWVREPHGIVLITGPTGSGKSTTLYATLEEINDGTSKIVTVEEPVEYNIPGVSQVQAHSEIGYTFARALRAILRQDPDRIMIGEIRDLETAEIAVQAALTGHMVFSTIHTNDAIGAIPRLIDMGVEPFLVASSIRAVIAQRLVRQLCTHCAQPDRPSSEIEELLAHVLDRRPELGRETAQWRKAVGCKQCQGIGFKGRAGIYEMVQVTGPLQDAIMQRAATQDLSIIARKAGLLTLREDGLLKARRGKTTVDEVLRVTGLGENA